MTGSIILATPAADPSMLLIAATIVGLAAVAHQARSILQGDET